MFCVLTEYDSSFRPSSKPDTWYDWGVHFDGRQQTLFSCSCMDICPWPLHCTYARMTHIICLVCLIHILALCPQPAPWASDMFDGIKAPRYPNYNASSEFQQQKHWVVRQIGGISAVREKNIDMVFRNRVQGLQSVDKVRKSSFVFFSNKRLPFTQICIIALQAYWHDSRFIGTKRTARKHIFHLYLWQWI